MLLDTRGRCAIWLSRDCTLHGLSGCTCALQVAIAIARIVREVSAAPSVPATNLAALLIGLIGGPLPIHVTNVANIVVEANLSTAPTVPVTITATLRLGPVMAYLGSATSQQ